MQRNHSLIVYGKGARRVLGVRLETGSGRLLNESLFGSLITTVKCVPTKGSIVKLRKITGNSSELALPDGTKVLFSYADAVAAFVPGSGWLKTNSDMSKATAWAVKEWLCEQDAENVRPVEQAVLDTLLAVREQVR
jgi:hypothetical protein